MRRVAQERSFAPNEPVFKEGNPGDGIYVVKDGAVNLTKVVVGGEARRLSRAQEGDLFGEMAVLDDNPRSLGAWAEGNTTVYFIPRPELLKLLSRIPRLAVAIVRDTCQRIRDFNEKYVKEVLEAEKLSLVGRFASSIAHDLKNPLNIIGISADLACLPSSTEVSRQASQVRIRKQVDRISNMVNELLEFVQGSHTSFILARLDYSAFVLQLIEEISIGGRAQIRDLGVGSTRRLRCRCGSTLSGWRASSTISSATPPMPCRTAARSGCLSASTAGIRW